MMQQWVLLTEAQKNESLVYDNDEVRMGARRIDAATPGVGINQNPDALGVPLGTLVPLTGLWVANLAIIVDPDYLQFAPDMCAYLTDKPWCLLESTTIFAPPPEI